MNHMYKIYKLKSFSHNHYFQTSTFNTLDHSHFVNVYTFPVNGSADDGHVHYFKGITKKKWSFSLYL